MNVYCSIRQLYEAASCMVTSNRHHTPVVHLVLPFQKVLEPVATRTGKVDLMLVEALQCLSHPLRLNVNRDSFGSIGLVCC